jgi:hypothetical protein
VTFFAQLKVDVPAGFEGDLYWPLIPWDVQGVGTVTYGGVSYAAGSNTLTTLLQGKTTPPMPLHVAAAGPVSVVYLVNPMRFSMDTDYPGTYAPTVNTQVEVETIAPAVLRVDLVPLAPANRLGFVWPFTLAKPR